MDIDELIKHSRARFDHDAQKELLKEKYQARLNFVYADGLWHAGPELLGVLHCCHTDEVVLLDLYDNPIKVCVSELINLAHSHWQEQMNAWLVEYEKTRRQR